jgi:tetratricopeptide (TPR) repeat protein
MVTQGQLDQLWDFTDPAASEYRLLDASREPGATPELRAELETQVARALGLQSRYDDANRMLDRVIFDSPPVTTRVLLERGRILNSSGHPSDAIPSFSSAQLTANRANLTFLEVDALHMLAIADPDNAVRWTDEALAVLEGTDDERTKRWAVALHNNLGWHLHDADSYDDALTQFSLAQGAAIRFGTEDQRFQSRWAFARCLRSLGRTKEAMDIQRELAVDRPEDDDVTAELAALNS